MSKLIVLILFVFSSVIFAKNNLSLGEYPLKGDVDHAVVDGDTIKVKGLDKSIRILFIDTEESFKHGTARDKTLEISGNWDYYLSEQMSKMTDKPVKFNTPLGFQATLWAREFFKDSDTVRLEYDSNSSKKGYYGRYLTYVFAKKDGKWVNFNIEIVKHGYTPYSTKYGRSRRFHKEFVEAQEFAKKRKLGIWSKKGKHYPDYDIRLKWWDKRGEQIDDYRKNGKKDGYLFIGGSDYDYFKLKDLIDKKVKIFALVKSVEEDKEYYTFKLPAKKFVDVFVHVLKKSGVSIKKLKKNEDYYIYLTGTVKEENNRYHIYINSKKDLKFLK